MKKSFALTLLMFVALLWGACSAPQTSAPAPADTTAAVPAATGGTGDFVKPHPILTDIRVRRALATCIDRDALIGAVFPYVTDDLKPQLHMDSFLPKSHWAYKGPYMDYPHDAQKGGQLLDEAGWKLPEGAQPGDGSFRVNANGDTLTFKLTTTNAQFRQTWAAVVEQNLAECGVLLIRQHVPASWFFGNTTGLQHRDFELGGFGWTGTADPGGQTLYACNQIPEPSNNWQGQNYMGWCNQDASNAIILANNTLKREDRIAAYDTVEKHFAEDMVSIPLFQRAEAEAWSKRLEGLKVDPTEYGTASAAQWKLADGADTIVVGMSQEPASMFTLVESAAVQAQMAEMGIGMLYSQYNYDFQPVLQDGLPTVENGQATNAMVDVKVDDQIYSADGELVKLAKGVKLISEGKIITYDGTSALKLPQLKVTYKLKPYTWSDGTPGSIEDVKLADKISCDRKSGAVSFITCDQIAKIDYTDHLEWTVTYVPGAQPATYFIAPQGNAQLYPSQEKLSDGRLLKDVPAEQWATLPEIAEKPLSFGPFVIAEWVKGQSMTLEANPHYADGTGVKKIVVQFIPDTNQAVAQLLSGDVDYLEKTTLGAGSEVQTVMDAVKAGTIKGEVIPSPSWEHIDMNLFTR
ncbi:MAG: ABC transporter substrate-binding protein [Chloroflexi bacterium]|nr:ABC transporter substrate-binding protein [Chloroflexota bacterium]